MYSVLVAATYPLILQGLRALLQGEPDIRWVGEARTAGQLSGRASELQPDVSLIDGDLIDAEGAEFIGELRRIAPQMALVVVSTSDALASPLASLRLGVRGLLPRTATAAEMAQAIRAAAEGLTVVHPAFLSDVIDNEASFTPTLADLVEPLTERERQVLQLIAHGLPNKQIAAQLAITDHTVKYHIRAILGKLGVANRTEAVAAGLQRGLVTL